MTGFNPKSHPHRRYNPLTGEWILVSPQRTQRPWQGYIEEEAADANSPYDPKCYLCPGNRRAGNAVNPCYKEVYVFENDFAALRLDTPSDWKVENPPESALLQLTPEIGCCRVICFSPRHDLTMPQLGLQNIESIIRTWMEQFQDLGGQAEIGYVQIFENKGAVMGCSNPHPHGQIWASSSIPNEPAKEDFHQKDFLESHSQCLLCDYLRLEQRQGERIVLSNAHFSVLVPFWAIWPFETLLLSHRHIGSITELSTPEIAALASIIKQLAVRYDNLFRISFPYSMGFHQQPTNGRSYAHWHFHAHYYPPLLRSATIRKFMVGYEMLAGPQRDLTPEAGADRLRSLSNVHYLSSGLSG